MSGAAKMVMGILVIQLRENWLKDIFSLGLVRYIYVALQLPPYILKFLLAIAVF